MTTTTTTTTTTTQLKNALALAAAGFYVHPLKGKVARVKSWPELASIDTATIERWWQVWPDSNVGIATGKSNLIVIDIDAGHGVTIDTLGLSQAELKTPISITGGGGNHIYYKQPPGKRFGNSNTLPTGIDTRGDGGNINAPGSVHPDTGNLYTWMPGRGLDDVDILDLPEILWDRITDKNNITRREPVYPVKSFDSDELHPYARAALDGSIDELATAPDGERNNTLNRAAYGLAQLVAGGALPENETFYALEQTALVIGLTEQETAKTLNSGFSAGLKIPRYIPENYSTILDKDGGFIEYELNQAARTRRDSILAAAVTPKLQHLTFDAPLTDPEYDKCPYALEHNTWSSDGGKGATYFYCNEARKCKICRQRHGIKLKFYLDEIATRAYIDNDGNAAYALPKENEHGDFVAGSPGPGVWYGKVILYSERRNFIVAYRAAKPNGFIRPEVYPVLDGGNNKCVILSLAPFRDMQPIEITDSLCQRIAIGAADTKAALLFAPPRKTLKLSLPRYTFELPKYLDERGIIATIKAAHSILFTGPVALDDIYSSFDTKATTFDEIRLILDEIGEKSIDRDRLRGIDDFIPDYVVHSIHIVPDSKNAYLNVFNAGREGDTTTRDKYRRKWPKMPKLSDSVAKVMYTKKDYMTLATNELEPAYYEPGYHEKIEYMLQNEL